MRPDHRAIRLMRDVRWPLCALAVLLIFDAIVAPELFTLEMRDGRLYGTLADILNHASRAGIVAIGMTLVIATGGVDLSVGAIVAVSGAVLATLASSVGAPWPVAILGAILTSAVLGVWNGALVSLLRLQPIVATLVLMVAGRGAAQLISNGLIVTIDSPALAAIGNGALLGLPTPFWMMLVIALGTWVVTRRTSAGLFIEAVGDNPRAARLAGVNERLVVLCIYGFCGVCAGIVGLVECSYIKAADSNNAGQLLELDAILAVVIGGTSLRGGRFNLAGSLLGALLMQTLTKTLYMLNVPAEIAPAPKALLVLFACLLQSAEFRGAVKARFRRQVGGAP